MGITDQSKEETLYEEWMTLQGQELSQLRQAIALNADGGKSDADLSQLLDTILNHFEEYAEKRSRMARDDVTPFLAPGWCSTLERSGMWIAGRRPSSYIRLVYALSGMDVESHLVEFLQGANVAGCLGGLSGEQMNRVDKLHRVVIKEEDKLSSKMATLQEDMSDLQPLASIAKQHSEHCHPSEGVDEALDKHGRKMAGVLEEADKLRVKITREIIAILTPAQAANFLAAGKKLTLCLREWGKKRDVAHGRK